MSIDLIQRGVVTHDYTYAVGTGSLVGTGPESIDGNFSTYYGGYYNRQYGGGSTTAYVYSKHEWAIPCKLESIRASLQYDAWTLSGANIMNYAEGGMYLYVKLNGSWVNVYGYAYGRQPYYGGVWENWGTSYNTTLYPPIAGWTATAQNITGVYAYVYGTAIQVGGGGAQYTNEYIYELQAFGSPPPRNNQVILIG